MNWKQIVEMHNIFKSLTKGIIGQKWFGLAVIHIGCYTVKESAKDRPNGKHTLKYNVLTMLPMQK